MWYSPEAAIHRFQTSELLSARPGKSLEKNDQNKHNSPTATRVQDELIAILTRAQRLNASWHHY
jgi:hypothetical protein